MSPPPTAFLEHLKAEGYHPRSDKHSNALAKAIVDDLIERCPTIRAQATAGLLVYGLNFTIRVGITDWNVDLVLGPPAVKGGEREAIACQDPTTVRIAIELKSVMTEHRKAVKNRKRDLEAHHEYVHKYDNNAIAAGVLVVNASECFKSPLRSSLTTHKNPDALVEHCLNELRSVSARGGTTGSGLEAKCGIVVNTDNIDHAAAVYAAVLNPPLGDPISYDAFIQVICDKYRERFSA